MAVPVAVAVEDLVVEGRVRHVLTLLSSRGVVGSRIGLTVLYSRGEVTQRRRHAASEASARVTVGIRYPAENLKVAFGLQ